MTRALLGLVVLLGPAVLANAFESVDDSRRWAITGLSVIDVETGAIAPNQTIVIQNGIIQAIGDAASVPASPDLIVLDHAGHYAIPGLWDMHVHLRGGPELIDANERWLRQYLGFGVTAVRDTGGDLPSSVLHWQAEIAVGSLRGPRIYSALRKLDGGGARQPGSIPIESAANIDAALDYLTLAGADFVKLYDFSLSEALYPVAVGKAESRGIKTTAHVPPSVPLRALLDAGLDGIEHAFFLVKAAHPDDLQVSQTMAERRTADYLGYFEQFAEISDGSDDATARRVFREMAELGTAVTSNLEIEHAIYAFLAGEGMDRSRLEQTPASIRATHADSHDYLASLATRLLPAQKKIRDVSARLLAMAAAEGVMILAGSDAGTNNPFVYPGDTLHTELKRMVESGLSPLKALQSATVNPPRWLELGAAFGTLAPDAVADIVILERNPLDDIVNTRAIAAVVQQGVYFDAGELDELKRLVGR